MARWRLVLTLCRAPLKYRRAFDCVSRLTLLSFSLSLSLSFSVRACALRLFLSVLKPRWLPFLSLVRRFVVYSFVLRWPGAHRSIRNDAARLYTCATWPAWLMIQRCKRSVRRSSSRNVHRRRGNLHARRVRWSFPLRRARGQSLGLVRVVNRIRLNPCFLSTLLLSSLCLLYTMHTLCSIRIWRD